MDDFIVISLDMVGGECVEKHVLNDIKHSKIPFRRLASWILFLFFSLSISSSMSDYWMCGMPLFVHTHTKHIFTHKIFGSHSKNKKKIQLLLTYDLSMFYKRHTTLFLTS